MSKADLGRYSRVSRRVWNDERFRSLSRPKPSGAWLFFRLLTGPELTNIPGLFQAWEAGLAQALDWPLAAFRKAFREIEQQRLAKADWDTGLIWLPNSIRHNEPESPNVVTSWRTAWEELPDCSLKHEARASLWAWAEAKGEPWVKAIEKATGKPSWKASDNPRPNQKQDQEQKQEQKQEQDPPNPRPGTFPMRTDWLPSEELFRSFDTALIPRWGSMAIIARWRSHFVPKKQDFRTQEEWEQSCSKWVHGDWNDLKKRPKKPEADASGAGAVDVSDMNITLGAEGL